MFTQIHEIVFHGKGGYNYSTVYNMPIWLRNFTFQKINEFYEKEKADTDKISKKQPLTQGPAVKTPTYSTKARK